MSRYTDVFMPRQTRATVDLPAVDWGSIGATAPAPLPVDYQGPDAPLPEADVVVITWTSAEWNALDHVFCNSGSARSPYDTDWRKDWYAYEHDASGWSGGTTGNPLWGFYRLVKVTAPGGGSVTVLVFKSSSHLAHPPWIAGLTSMVKQVAAEAKPRWIYSIGTAGGTRLDEALGDVVVTNAGHLQLEKSENKDSSLDGTTVVCPTFPSTDLFTPVQDKLLFALDQVATWDEYGYLVDLLHKQVSSSAPFGVKDLVDAPLTPDNLKQARPLLMKDTPLLTTDYYYIATGDDAKQWAVLEMDDTVVGAIAQQAGANFAFVRNVSDPLVASTAQDGTTIPDEVRDGWSGLVYDHFGFYTSGNGALVTWAAIAGQA